MNIGLKQCFPTFFWFAALMEEKCNLRYPVVNPQQFALKFDDIFKMYF